MKLPAITRVGRIRTTDEISTLRDRQVVITPPRTLLEVEADNGVAVGIVDLAHLLGDVGRQLASLSDRLAAVEGLAKAKPGDTPEVEKLKKKILDAAEGRKTGNKRSAEARGKKRKRWEAEIGAHISTLRANEPNLTKDEIITRLTDETQPWPSNSRRKSRSTLEKAKDLWK